MLTMWTLAGVALAGDLWLTVEKAEAEQVTVNLPADWLLEEGDPVRLQTESGAVELRHEARQLKRGSASWTLQEDDGPVEVTLAHRTPTGDPASQLTLSALGPLGMGLNLSFPLEADRLGDARHKVGGAVDIEGLQLDLDDAACEQLRRSPPTVLLQVVEDGHTFRIATR
jgi:hypothetical protein